MKERPILFSSEMVRVILEGKKTQTRRAVKLPQWAKTIGCSLSNKAWMDNAAFFGEGAEYLKVECFGGKDYGNTVQRIYCLYGVLGDRLWVRETWAEQSGDIYHKADWQNEKPVNMFFDKVKWRSGLFMPRWASRITLEITGVRVERLQEISGKDIRAEGLDVQFTIPGAFDALKRFSVLWDALNAKRGYGWETNPWVFVTEFRNLPWAEGK